MSTSTAPIALTGATGFLGGHIASALLAAGLPLRAVVRNPQRATYLADLGAEVVQADLTDVDALNDALSGAQALISKASLGSWAGTEADYERVNVAGIDNLLSTAESSGIRRVVMISTVAVYRTQLNRTMAEDAPRYDVERRRFNWSDATTDWRYARSKTRAEAVARSYDLDLTILRPGPIYGSRDPKLTARYLKASLRRLVVAPTVGVPQVHAADVALATVAALQRPESIGKAYNITAPPTSPYAVQRTLQRLRREGNEGRRSGWVVPLPLPVFVSYDISAAARDLGFAPRSLRAGLREVLAVEQSDRRAR